MALDASGQPQAPVILTPRSQIGAGGMSPDALRRQQRIFVGAYAPTGVEIDEEHRWSGLRAAVGSGPTWAGVTAGRMLGAPIGTSSDPLEMVGPTSGHHRHRQGVRMRRMALEPRDQVEGPYGPCLSPLRTAVDLAARARQPWQIGAVDQLLRVTGLTTWAVRSALEDERFRGMRGRTIARRALEQADPRSESVPESELRLRIVRIGLPTPEPQLEVADEHGVFVGRLDLGWEEVRVGIEYDGGYHDDPDQYRQDRRRHNRFRSCGWTVYQVDRATARDEVALMRMLRPHFPRLT